MAGETKVILQAASDAWMGVRSEISGIYTDALNGATTTVPLIEMYNGLCIPVGTTVKISNSLEPTLNGNTYLVSDVRGAGDSSFFCGDGFYLQDLDGSAVSAVTARAGGGEVQWTFSDDDPRKMYGLPYHYIKHRGTHEIAWTTGAQQGRSRKYAVDNEYGSDLTKQEFVSRTKWDYIAPALSSKGGGMVPGFAFADKSDSLRQAGSIVTKCEEVDVDPGGGESYSAVIHTLTPHFAEAGDLFTTRDFNKDKLDDFKAVVGVDYPHNIEIETLDPTWVFQVQTVLDNLRFSVYKTADQNGKTHLLFDCTDTGTAGSGSDRGARVVFEGKSAHSDDYLSTPSRMPTTTKFQLNVTDITHTFDDMVSVTPMMKSSWDGRIHEQVQNVGYSMGMRKETMKISGTLRDSGPISVTNVRKQVLMNICRTQWLKISSLWGGKSRNSGSKSKNGYQHDSPDHTDFRGNGYSGPVNPRSYPCITIYDPKDQSSSDNTKVDKNPDGGYNIYRGIIKNLSFTQEGGKPDIWQWSLDFAVMSNEKPAAGTLEYEVPEETEEN